MRVVWTWVFSAVVGGVLLGVTASWAVSSVVHGASFVKVRRGPGTDYPAFARLQEGERVEVEAVEGAWASIKTAAGLTGYVYKEYLSFPGSATARQAPEASRNAPVVTAEKLEEPDARDAQLEAQIDAVRQQFATAEAAESPPQGSEAQPVLTVDIQNDLHRLLRLTEELRRQIDSIRNTRPSVTAVPSDSPDEMRLVTTAWMLFVGVLFGAIVGSAYGRYKERRRRTRVRF